MGSNKQEPSSGKEKVKKSQGNIVSKNRNQIESKQKKTDSISKNSIVDLFKKSNERSMMNLTMNNERNESNEVDLNKLNKIEISSSSEHILPTEQSEHLPIDSLLGIGKLKGDDDQLEHLPVETISVVQLCECDDDDIKELNELLLKGE